MARLVKLTVTAINNNVLASTKEKAFIITNMTNIQSNLNPVIVPLTKKQYYAIQIPGPTQFQYLDNGWSDGREVSMKYHVNESLDYIVAQSSDEV